MLLKLLFAVALCAAAVSAQSDICKSRKLASNGAACTCADTNCFSCAYEAGKETACTQCRNTKFLFQGKCVDEAACPADMVKLSDTAFNRACVAPFRCVDGKNAATGAACACPDATCLDCTVGPTAAVCARCDATRLLGDGVCVRTLTCQGSTYMHKDVKLTGRTCACRPQHPNCVNCDVTVAGLTATGAQNLTRVCNSCKTGNYLLNGACLVSCPAGLSQVGVQSEFGRKCMAPFTCRASKIIAGVPDLLGKACTCPDVKNCHTCAFTADGPSRSGQICLSCKNSFFLSGGLCVLTCPAGTTATGTGSYGRTCVPVAGTTTVATTTTTTTKTITYTSHCPCMHRRVDEGEC